MEKQLLVDKRRITTKDTTSRERRSEERLK
jgi:hypothetical protein